MDVRIGLVGLLLVTGLTGSLALLAWGLVRRPLVRCGSLRWCQMGLWAVAVLYLVPAAFGIMVWRVGHYVSWGGAGTAAPKCFCTGAGLCRDLASHRIAS